LIENSRIDYFLFRLDCPIWLEQMLETALKNGKSAKQQRYGFYSELYKFLRVIKIGLETQFDTNVLLNEIISETWKNRFPRRPLQAKKPKRNCEEVKKGIQREIGIGCFDHSCLFNLNGSHQR
jgi:hypothetical protein